MKTRVYIDGYNFYFGCLKGTSYKWLERPLHPADHLPNFDGIPNEHMDDENLLEIMLQHAKAYAEHKLSR